MYSRMNSSLYSSHAQRSLRQCDDELLCLFCGSWNIYTGSLLLPQVQQFMSSVTHILRGLLIAEYGGIYLDHDVIVLKSLNPLRNYDVTLGREMPSLLANGVIVARQGAPFLRIWLETYRNYDRRSWAAHSTHTPHR